ncbi:hypothetical protein LOZ65_004415 [Ophidiomyces ophidiicola]|nr:hypothetical protein LOZ65_004415 [Ophidiomyces ophidiicola]
MSLYFDAVTVLAASPASGGSLKSRIYNSRLKSSPPQIYALITETTKWNAVLKEVVDKSGILAHEPKLTPLLSLLLTHDLLLSKRGIAAPSSHPLRLAVERHKTRLNAELTKLRVRRGYATVDELRSALNANPGSTAFPNPRWVRINNARTTLDQELKDTFRDYHQVTSISELATCEGKGYYLDKHIPDLLAVASTSQLLSYPAYKEGRIIFQDKASCFPAYLLLGSEARTWHGKLIDGCAAPGNKTTHLASLLSAAGNKRTKIYSLDASPARSKILQKMVAVAGVDNRVAILAGQDFLALDPQDARFADVTALLLDPSCSGSGILKREDVPQLDFPEPRSRGSAAATTINRKRKRKAEPPPAPLKTFSSLDDDESAVAAEHELEDGDIDLERLTKLSNLQVQIVEHAFKFPAATRITYSTCSVHAQENENVVARLLASSIAQGRGWKLLPRAEQVEGLRRWEHRGWTSGAEEQRRDPRVGEGEPWRLTHAESQACLRCAPGDGEGTGGFFVAAFTRDRNHSGSQNSSGVAAGSDGLRGQRRRKEERQSDDDCVYEEWEGFETD